MEVVVVDGSVVVAVGVGVAGGGGEGGEDADGDAVDGVTMEMRMAQEHQ